MHVPTLKKRVERAHDLLAMIAGLTFAERPDNHDLDSTEIARLIKSCALEGREQLYWVIKNTDGKALGVRSPDDDQVEALSRNNARASEV